MSNFWDTIKPHKPAPVAVQVDLSPDAQQLTLIWDDGKTTHVSAQSLRQNCPCAECVEEWSGKRTLDPSTVPNGLKVLEIAPVGNYALCFTFGDLHKVGIFHWKSLRELSA